LTVEKGTILRWMKKEGRQSPRRIDLRGGGDKVTTEVESPASGVLKKILIPEGLKFLS